MNNFEKIYKYLSGDMSEIEEKSFYQELAKDENLLEEFNKQKSIKDVLKKDNFQELSNSSSKENIFMNLGLDLPTSAAKVGAISLLKNKWFSFLTYAGVSIISGVIVYILFNNYFETEYTKINNKLIELKSELVFEKEKNKFLNNNNNKLNEELLRNKVFHENELSELKKSKNEIQYIDRIIYKEKLVSKDIDIKNKVNNLNKDINSINELDINELNIVDIDKASLITDDYLNSNNDMKQFNNNYIPRINKVNYSLGNILDKFSFEYTGNYDLYEINPRTTPNRFSSFNNNSFSIFYNFSDNFDLGLNFIGENFSLKYINTEQDGEYWYYQTPNYLTSSLIGKYRIDLTKKFNISPYLMSGMNRTGFVFRGGLGVKYMFNDYVGILLNSHYSNMIFENKNLINYSGKYSFQLGVSWKK